MFTKLFLSAQGFVRCQWLALTYAIDCPTTREKDKEDHFGHKGQDNLIATGGVVQAGLALFQWQWTASNAVLSFFIVMLFREGRRK